MRGDEWHGQRRAETALCKRSAMADVEGEERVMACGDVMPGVGGLMSLSTPPVGDGGRERWTSVKVPVPIRPLMLTGVLPLAAPSAQGAVPGTVSDIPITVRPSKCARPASSCREGFVKHPTPKATPSPGSGFRPACKANRKQRLAMISSRKGLVGEAPEKSTQRQYRNAIFGYDIRLVHSLIACVCEWTLSNDRVIDLNWEEIAASLDSSANLSPRECQALWRYVAYHMDEFGDCRDPNFKFSTASLSGNESDIDLPATRVPHINGARSADTIIADSKIVLNHLGMPVSANRTKRKWTTSADVKLLKGILEVGEGQWDQIRVRFGLSKRPSKSLESRWRVMQRSISAGRYKNERVLTLIDAIQRKSCPDEVSSDVRTAADAMTALMGFN